jgi:hypothetical protein
MTNKLYGKGHLRFDPKRGLFWLGNPKRGGTLLPLFTWPPRYHLGALKTYLRSR